MYRRDAIERVGGYDETMIVAEDWELNYRIRAGGGLIWFTPELRVTYRPRATLCALASQHFRYGRWRRVVARRYPETVNRRYLAAPVATALNILGCGTRDHRARGSLDRRHRPFAPDLGFRRPRCLPRGRRDGAAVLARDQPAVRARVPLVLATMHMAGGWRS